MANLRVPCKVAMMDDLGLYAGRFPVRGAANSELLRQRYRFVPGSVSKTFPIVGTDRLGGP